MASLYSPQRVARVWINLSDNNAKMAGFADEAVLPTKAKIFEKETSLEQHWLVEILFLACVMLSWLRGHNFSFLP